MEVRIRVVANATNRSSPMSVLTLQGVVVNGKSRLAQNVNLPEHAKVYVVIPDGVTVPSVPECSFPPTVRPPAN